jgi:hypothetical protein
MNRLSQLRAAGVSIWLDTLSRSLLETGEFARLVREQAVTGATSNPTMDLTAITAQLERGGVSAFCDSYRQLLDCIESKLAVLPATAAAG